MKSVFIKYQLPNKNVFLLGEMNCGHRALKYIEYCKNKKSVFNPPIPGTNPLIFPVVRISPTYTQDPFNVHFNDPGKSRFQFFFVAQWKAFMKG